MRALPNAKVYDLKMIKKDLENAIEPERFAEYLFIM
jgi:hypothetical protein